LIPFVLALALLGMREGWKYAQDRGSP
jgi:hypothetical protein